MNFYEQELRTLQSLEKDFDDVSKNVLLGVAALTARIRQDMVETENEIARDFVESIAPEMLLPLPARSLVEIIPSPADNSVREIPNGALLCSKSKKHGEKPFFWRVMGTHKLNPLQKITSVKAIESEGFDCLEFESSGDGPWIIYIDGESDFAWTLWRLLLEHAKPIVSKSQNPWELCRDFFCFEEKFRYIYMENLPKRIRFAKKNEIFSKIRTENFKLNVLPVENAFEQNLEPVLLENDFEAKIFPNEERQVILHLKEVLAGNVKKTSFEKVKYRYGSNEIRFATPPKVDMLSIAAIVCDGVSANLERGSVLQAKNSAMQMCKICSVINALPFLPPVAGAQEWGILGLLQKNYLKFFEGDTLKNALAMQLWNAQGKRNYLVYGIRGVFLENKSAVHKGCLVPMAGIKIVFDINSHEFPGILHAMGEMLFELFKRIFICNMLVELILRVEPFGVELKWG
ncbi:MAG: type VI secretion system baseplate subunit TssF [Fibromonadaceae bacterium]|jgi:type VI protein secretion system component VasA|nr:type VI secretion system baseplate subunit TssF [Fibromonadaceae bacterium]